MSSMLLHSEVLTEKDFLPITGTDYLELYVGNARQAAYYYRAAFGMTLVACAGPQTGLRDRASYVLEQGGIRLVLTTPLRPDGGIADHIRRHGDGVRDIAVCVDDAKMAWREATRRGARSVHECHSLGDAFGSVKVASIAAYGDTIHTFVERSQYLGPFLPGYDPVDRDPVSHPVGLTGIDHIAANVGWQEPIAGSISTARFSAFRCIPRVRKGTRGPAPRGGLSLATTAASPFSSTNLRKDWESPKSSGACSSTTVPECSVSP